MRSRRQGRGLTSPRPRSPPAPRRAARRTGEGGERLVGRRRVWGGRGGGRGVLERRLGRGRSAAEKVVMGAGLKLDRSLFEVRVLIFAGPNPPASDHLAVLRSPTL